MKAAMSAPVAQRFASWCQRGEEQRRYKQMDVV